MSLRVITWNVNSVRLRLPLIARLTKEYAPDVLCLQETKVSDHLFPRSALAAVGYDTLLVRGMKGYNGVAILARTPVAASGGDDWCGRSDGRHVYAVLPSGLEIHNFYVPSGGDVPDPEVNDKFAHKLDFLRQMARWSRERRGAKGRVLVGDLNVAPLETDVWSHTQLLKVISHTPVEVDLLGTLMKAGDWIDAVRAIVPPERKLYSWWSYRARDWSASDRGRRLDHIWIGSDLRPALRDARVLREVRGWNLPSDHVPVVMDIAP